MAPSLPTALYHAHVYYGTGERTVAETLCLAAKRAWRIPMGRLHDGPIGPHPIGSCQLTVPAPRLDAVIEWLEEKRGPLTVMIHPVSNDMRRDHTTGVIWLGTPHALRLDIFD
ncbi:DOPA 4,5-dioxygenase family protein [Gimibacter soli]|uniref:DOPA 4,5-dioxygenase family protein n=1 Tax=Gimibacter soli TaxID=3024400 RepID=A0AAF0BLX9_9PROT|nr:DOPA 4,5-dioxygenase family protein [Gimibacter soli]WCL54722.1 DOPA 4,5-dioxygenase family protein [Gimibacter soli]